ncbi:MAG TPA: hypothetical protein VEB64_01355 [Azospirillaceae bacterium]|nr:hypothetical protein [Azospirillaceae bacterium]
MGKSVCPGRTLPMQHLDDMVLQAVRHLLVPDFLAGLLAPELATDAAAEQSRQARLVELRRDLLRRKRAPDACCNCWKPAWPTWMIPWSASGWLSWLQRDEMSTEIRLSERHAGDVAPG